MFNDNKLRQDTHAFISILVVNSDNSALDAILTCLEDANYQTIHAVDSAQKPCVCYVTNTLIY